MRLSPGWTAEARPLPTAKNLDAVMPVPEWLVQLNRPACRETLGCLKSRGVRSPSVECGRRRSCQISMASNSALAGSSRRRPALPVEELGKHRGPKRLDHEEVVGAAD